MESFYHDYDDDETQLWTAEIICVQDATDKDANYFMVLADDKITWLDAQTRCIKEYGSSLATVATQKDMSDAAKLAPYGDFQLFVGLFKNPGDDEDWQWVNGASW